MPRVDIWIRKEDLDKWNAITNRPSFIHNALNASEIVVGGIRQTKAKPGTVDPISGLEIKEFHTNANPEVDKLYEELLTPKPPVIPKVKIEKEVKVNDKKYGAVIFDESKMKFSEEPWQGSNFKKGKK